MLSGRSLRQLFTDSSFRLQTINRWSLSNECQPWLRRVGRFLLDRVTRVPAAEELMGPCLEFALDLSGIGMPYRLESLAGDGGRFWGLGRARAQSSSNWSLLEFSTDGRLLSSQELADIPQLAKGSSMRLVVVGGLAHLLSTPVGDEGARVAVYEPQSAQFLASPSDASLGLEPVYFGDDRGLGYLTFGDDISVYRFSPVLDDWVEWRRRTPVFDLAGYSCRQLVPWNDGWLGVVIAPSMSGRTRWLHRVISMDAKLGLRGVGLPFVLDPRGRACCEDFLLTQDGAQAVFTFRGPGDPELRWASWPTERVAAFEPCHCGELKFPDHENLKRLRTLSLTPE